MGVTLNPKKCEFLKDSLRFLGHIIDEEGISADSEKVRAITEIAPPSNTIQIRQLI